VPFELKKKKMLTTPKRINFQADQLIRALDLDPSSAVWMKLFRASDFEPEPGHCFVNCLVQQKLHQGDTLFGWMLWQDTTIQFAEAEFHCVWRSPDGALRDITPRVDGEKRICFVPDSKRVGFFDMAQQPYRTRTYGNVKIQGNSLLNTVQPIAMPYRGTSLVRHLEEGSNNH
jgi:hypothetical protein